MIPEFLWLQCNQQVWHWPCKLLLIGTSILAFQQHTGRVYSCNLILGNQILLTFDTMQYRTVVNHSLILIHINHTMCQFVCMFVCMFVCVFVCMFACFVGWLVGWLVVWLVGWIYAVTIVRHLTLRSYHMKIKRLDAWCKWETWCVIPFMSVNNKPFHLCSLTYFKCQRGVYLVFSQILKLHHPPIIICSCQTRDDSTLSDIHTLINEKSCFVTWRDWHVPMNSKCVPINNLYFPWLHTNYFTIYLVEKKIW